MLATITDHLNLVVVGGMVLVIYIVCATIKGIIETAVRERSRREIAAYIAEGSMTPEQGERLMKAEPESKEDW